MKYLIGDMWLIERTDNSVETVEIVGFIKGWFRERVIIRDRHNKRHLVYKYQLLKKEVNKYK